MSYQPKTWENKPSTASPINATNLNHMEGGIKTNDDNITDAQNAILTLQGEMLQAQGDISALETLVDSIFPVDTESGNPAVITDAFGGACKSLKLTFEPIQSGSGEKSPQNPYVISGRTQSVVARTGKNLFPLFTEETKNGITLSYNSGKLILDGTASSTAFFNITNLNIPSANYVISCNNTATANVHLTMRKIGGTSDLFDIPLNAANKTTTINNSIGSITMYVVSGTVLSNYEIGYQVEMGTTATDYEPYTSTSITRTYGTTIYGGSDDVTGEGAIRTKKLNEINGGFSVAGSGAFYKDGITDISDIPSLCNIYPMGAEVQGTGGANDHPKTLCWQKNGLQSLRLCIYDSDFADVAAFNTALAQTPMQVIFDLATPTSIPLTAQNITLLHGDNVLTTDADSIEVSYSADIALYIAKKIAEGISQGNRSLSKGGSSDEEVKEEVKEEEKREEIEIKEEDPLTKEVR